MASATPGGALGYDYDKKFGNNIAHSTARTSQRLRGYTARSPEVKGRTLSARFEQCNGVPAVRRGGICGSSYAGGRSSRVSRHSGKVRRTRSQVRGLRTGESRDSGFARFTSAPE